MAGELLLQVEQILSTDRTWAAYALADLQPAFAEDCVWYVSSSAEGAGVILLYRGLEPTILFTMGPGSAVEMALALADLPEQIYLNVRAEHLPLLTARYELQGELYPMWRMVLTEATPAAPMPVAGLVRLMSQDVDRIAALYRHGGPFTPGMFSAYQLHDGCFFGIEDNDKNLLAVGGTHIVDWQAGIAAIGNMYTHPAHRGQGYARTILQRLVLTLQAGKVNTIVLNVDQRNTGARALYEKLGFQVHTPFIEGVGVKRSASPPNLSPDLLKRRSGEGLG